MERKARWDLPAGSSSGLKEILKLVPKDEGIDVVNFQNKDIVRHRLVDKIVKAYSKLEKQKWINQNQFL